MRNVDPANDIPMTELTIEAQKERVKSFANKTRSALTQVRCNELTRMLDTGGVNGLSDKGLLKLLTEVADQILLDEISPFAVCRKGCGTCCKFPVHVSSIEAKIIASYSGKTMKKLKKTTLIPEKVLQDDYCPFFDKSSKACSIYEVRPLSCRLYSSLDHYEYCGGTEVHTQTTLQVTSPVNSGYMALSLRLDKRETQNKGAAAADIRYWFPEM
ncbi:TPA: YkgJ family cysteine cluster protein [Vibrio parahaemolyticus]|nr:YkgJ family cysteine cluster protein [Vibrio parahaemolyticus]UPR19035.1 YkgJ family cysteine cluster protein [Vibrio parahaemolyticus]HAV1520184.1 YkgJ family cysteine cluster protein [Vibrio parahaemolyticus]HAV1539150.1 YkgJ family cysteine cluster protein [Vibrio parahaemolyticus]